MKGIISCLVLAAGLITAAGCNNTSPERTVQESRMPPPDNIKHVLSPLKLAKNDIDTFVKLCTTSLHAMPINAYTVRAEDLLDALGLPTSFVDSVFNGDSVNRHVRIYLGYRKTGPPADTGFKLFIVPVEGANISGKDPGTWKAGKDLMLNDSGKAIKSRSQEVAAEDKYVLNLNAPCPKTCPDSSPLYNRASSPNKNR